MSGARLNTIAEKLLESSRNGTVSWKETADEDTFSVSYPSYSVSIEQKGSTTYALSVYNRHSTLVDSLIANERIAPELFGSLQEMFAIARRVGIGTDEVLDELLERLTSGGPSV